jgi:uncharacterized protein
MTAPLLMPKATAVWLVENTSLSFEQIADFCGVHPLEVQGIADGEVAIGIVGLDPVANGQLTSEEIKRCEADPSARLKMIETTLPLPVARTKGARYTPVAKRQDRPDAIAWLVRHHPELADAQIGRLVGTTKSTIQKIRDRTHWDIQNIKPRSPVALGLCTEQQLQQAVDRARRAAERAKQKSTRSERAAAKVKAAAAAEPLPAETDADTTPAEPVSEADGTE